MTVFGCNLDPRSGHHPSEAIGPGAPWIRSVPFWQEDLTPWLEAVRAGGGKNLLLLARESRRLGWTDAAFIRHYVHKYGPLMDALQIGNEPDAYLLSEHSPSSWSMRPARLARLLKALWVVLDGLPFDWEFEIVGPGLVSGQPSYVEALDAALSVPSASIWLDTFLDAIAAHLYDPDNANAVITLDAYRAVTNLPIWVTEFGGAVHTETQPHGIFQDEHARAQWVSQRMIALAEWDVPVAIQFSFHDYQGFGLMMKEGAATESYRAFFRCSRELAGTDPANGA